MPDLTTERVGGEEQLAPNASEDFSKGVVFTGLGTAANIICLLLETMIAARLLGTQEYGVYVLLVVVVGFLVMVVDFGYKTAVTQFVASSERARQVSLVSSALGFRLAILVIATGLVLMGRSLFLRLDPSWALQQYAVYIPAMVVVGSLDELLLAMLQGFKAYRHMAVAQIIRSVLRLCLTAVLLVYFDLGIIALIYSWVLSFAASVAYQYLVLPVPKRVGYDRSLVVDLLHFGLPLQGNRFLWFVSSRMDAILLGVLLGPTSVALYSIAARIPTALNRLSESFVAVYFPTISSLLSDQKRGQAEQMLARSLRLMSFLAAFAALVAILFSRQIVTLLFSQKYAASSGIFALLMVGLHMTVLVNLMGYTLTSAGFPHRSLGVNVARTGLAVSASVVLIPVLGVIGPAYANLVSYYAANALSVEMLRRSDIRVQVLPYVKQTGVLWLCAGLFWWIQPAEFVYKAAFIALFLVITIGLSTISADDFSLVLPGSVTKRLRFPKEVLFDGRG